MRYLLLTNDDPDSARRVFQQFSVQQTSGQSPLSPAYGHGEPAANGESETTIFANFEGVSAAVSRTSAPVSYFVDAAAAVNGTVRSAVVKSV